MNKDCVRRVGKSRVVSLLNIGMHPAHPVYQLEAGQHVDGVGITVSAATYQSQRMILSAGELLTIYEMIEPLVPNLRKHEQEKKPQSEK